MQDAILSYREMCNQENVQNLQRGMNFRLHPGYSVLLMSQRKNAPYNDRIHDDGVTIEYEGHDAMRYANTSVDVKLVDQPRYTKSGGLTQNGQFANAIDKYKDGVVNPEIVRIYEKILPGIWSEKGFFELKNYQIKQEGPRKVFVFVLQEVYVDRGSFDRVEYEKPRSRLIPSAIKRMVWERDKGRCVLCGEESNLHFDHELPYAKGGSSDTVENVRILCARHNLQKSDKIE